jgi:hypothetical protein
VRKQFAQFGLKRRVVARFQVRALQFLDGRHQHFRHEAPAVGAEVAG